MKKKDRNQFQKQLESLTKQLDKMCVDCGDFGAMLLDINNLKSMLNMYSLIIAGKTDHKPSTARRIKENVSTRIEQLMLLVGKRPSDQHQQVFEELAAIKETVDTSAV